MAPKPAEQIRHELVFSEFYNAPAKFCPEGSLDKLMEKEFILRALSKRPANISPERLEKTTTFISEKARRIFAIWISIGFRYKLYEVMELFMNNKACDAGLPFTEKELSKITVESLQDDEDYCEAVDVTNFLLRQWEFCAPVFSAEKENHDVDEKAILPFTEKHSTTAREGAFGEVMKYAIHKSHIHTEKLNITDIYDLNKMPRPKYVAVKRIKLEAREDKEINITGWEKEVRALWKMREFNQEHIVKFITAFRRKDEHYLILEWANGGNLRNLWESFRRELSPELIKDAFGQLLGLSEALSQVHQPELKDKWPNRHFRHGDLKPENILWFRDSNDPRKIGTLKIGDWGLAKQHQDLTQVRTKKTSTGFGTRLYEPPEEVTVKNNNLLVPDPKDPNGKTARKRSRLYDVWAMGCIWFEFLVWLMYGQDGLARLKSGFDRVKSDFIRFYEIDEKDVAKVHRVVKEWMDHMAEDKVCKVGQTALGDLLELIRDRLLVVELPDGFGSAVDLSSQPRPSSQPLASRQQTQGPSVSENPQAPLSIPGIKVEDTEAANDQSLPRTQEDFVPKPLPTNRKRRIRSADLYDQMAIIVSEDNLVNNAQYWLSGAPRSPLGDTTRDTGRRNETSTAQFPSSPSGGLSVTQAQTLALTERLDEDWKRIIDNDMADSIMSSLKAKGLLDANIPEPAKLCQICRTFRNDVWRPIFSISYTVEHLERNSSSNACGLCSVLLKLTQQAGNKSPFVHLSRERSTILLNSYTPVATLFRSSDLKTEIDSQIQVGLPTRPSAGSTAYLDIIRQWLLTCDDSHSMCRRDSNNFGSSGTSKRLPTRVIAVGKDGNEKVRLIETDSSNEGEWVALSHQWGTGTQFRTLRTNVDAHRAGISMEELPATFRDSVIMTRALGCPYLWIDSICIIQGPDGDFSQEAKRMEQVYSGAYCVLAASRSPGHSAGFLGPRKEALSVTLRGEGSEPFYLREIIDDFQSHVLEGSLNGRGWVLQEHALARRTIYFTEHQTYFECGDGVHCESIQRATFLGDPNFPLLMMEADRGAKILGYQDLYKLYSGLALTRPSDRPWAINGLQERIISALQIQGQFGVFFEDRPGGRRRGLLRRSLLWCRSETVASLDRISFPAGSGALMVPSWSWMAYSGSIDYIAAEFGGTEWEPLQSQWDSGDERTDSGVLVGLARDYDVEDTDSMLVFDSPLDVKKAGTLCIVLGKQKGDMSYFEKVHYVLLVQPMPPLSDTRRTSYERVGAGTLLGKCIKGGKREVYVY
ncbi:hypothetical protein J7337_012962 [Fusarium musae]|uniref:Protein kinase domain-containing protein n=1 Tax=Fusarium musae TaxID=1042133 RepID=A0A9P8D6S6_9HYPO|nr:hypothetical protein J7337_012962 [Fusarium musae]KAG9496374.1 hypothetical protein J7337_012962 [Fusarium musae]